MASFMQRFSLKTKIIGKRSTKKYLEEALYRRLFKDGVKENCVGKNLNEFLKSRKSAYKWEVSRSVKLLREKKLYSPAVKLSEKMEKRGMNKTASDQAVHLDLVAKSKGIAAAEAYFTNLSEASKNHFTYGSLLNCYCKELMTEKAEALFEKMKELNLQLTSMPYNSLMTLYSRTGHPEKIPAIIQEMKEGDVLPDCFTYNVWMRALAALGDVSGAERVIDEMKRDGRVAQDWTTYSNLASVYADAGLHDKAENALKELEKKNTTRNLIAYQFLITLYGRIGKLIEVYRVWRTLRLAFPKTANISYLNMIQTLIKLDDLPGAEKCFKEWECGERRMYDIRIANSLIEAYAKQGSLEKAKELKKQAQKGGAKPNAKTWEIFLDYHMKNRETSSAVECIGNAISAAKGDGRRKWVPSAAIVGELMRQYETEKDVDGAERFVVVLKRVHDQLSNEVVELLIRTYAAAGKTSPIMRRRVKMEKAELSGEAMKLLDVICVE